ncbi:AAA family ATPase [Sutcliffiella horikoshii]|uniref:Nuclease SbcCD subunit C n=1 Tax=Sutcliffiella horikoshii TaxID=79883 RepID=A0A5D4T8Z3_9BACI|nr:AAA family ATPase [Sutcliffiella horikoshii]TYS71749.1 AAA family ATPase [Sutcliffiella horikoshii]
MKLLEISLKNFRQFYGEQTIEFSHGDKNITIIFGENGKGKTGIFRALMFGLYGSTHIQQDNPRERIHLVNFLALEENLNMPVEAKVKVTFEYHGKKYILERTVVGFKTGERIEERIQQTKLNIVDSLGNYSADPITDKDEISRTMNEILHESIKDFFLFDAEKIETLAKSDTKVKEEVKNGIVKLLQIDKVESAISILKKLQSSEKKRVLDGSKNLDLTRKQNEIDELKTSITNMEERIKLKESNKVSCAQEITEIESKLAENEDVRRIQEKHTATKEKKSVQQRLAKSKQAEIKNDLVRNGYNLVMKESYSSVKSYLDQILVDQKDLIPIEVIEKSLRDKTCACCNNNLQVHQENLQHIEQLRQNYKRSELTPLISLISSGIHDFSLEEEEIMDVINRKLVEFREIKQGIDEIDKQLQQYNAEIQGKAQEQENLKQLESTLQSKKDMLHSLGVEIESLKTQIKEKEKEFEAQEKAFKRLMRENESLRIDAKVLQIIDDLKDNFGKVFNEYSDEMRHKLTTETTLIFKELIDRKDKELINRIDINEKYEINIIGWDGVDITQDISQGQRQVVALSFITSLAKVASGGSADINFPLFMDTPFGRISGNNRDHLIDNIPNLTSQWILLLTDTELSKTEEMRFKSTNKLGKWYKLDQITTGHSKIVPMNIMEAMATRG